MEAVILDDVLEKLEEVRHEWESQKGHLITAKMCDLPKNKDKKTVALPVAFLHEIATILYGIKNLRYGNCLIIKVSLPNEEVYLMGRPHP